MYNEMKKDLELLKIENVENLTVTYVTSKYKKMAKVAHPDKQGGQKEYFQELQQAYKRLIKHIETTGEIGSEDAEDNHEKEFFMKNNLMKECSTSIVIYIQNLYVDNWKQTLERHLNTHSVDKSRTIYKTGQITLTLYYKPKKDPRSKIHIQSANQEKNIEFVFEKLSLFYKEVCKQQQERNSLPAIAMKQMQKAACGKCGKLFTDKNGVKRHILRMHVDKPKIVLPINDLSESKHINDINPTLEEHADQIPIV